MTKPYLSYHARAGRFELAVGIGRPLDKGITPSLDNFVEALVVAKLFMFFNVVATGTVRLALDATSVAEIN